MHELNAFDQKFSSRREAGGLLLPIARLLPKHILIIWMSSQE